MPVIASAVHGIFPDDLAELRANRRRPEDETDKLLAAHFVNAVDHIETPSDCIRAAWPKSAAASRTNTTRLQPQPHREGTSAPDRPLTLLQQVRPHGKRRANQISTAGAMSSKDKVAFLGLAERLAFTASSNPSQGFGCV